MVYVILYFNIFEFNNRIHKSGRERFVALYAIKSITFKIYCLQQFLSFLILVFGFKHAQRKPALNVKHF